MSGIIPKILQGICQLTPDDEPKYYSSGMMISAALKMAWPAGSACNRGTIIFQAVKYLLILDSIFDDQLPLTFTAWKKS